MQDKTLRIVGTITSIVGFTMMLICIIGRDEIIINFGIRIYNILEIMEFLILAISFVSFWAALIVFAKRKKEKRIMEKLEADEVELIEQNKEKESYLSASSKLEEHLLRQELKRGYENEWECAKKELSALFDQSLKMDEYQEKLSDLLRKNGANALDDTEEILDKAEQHILHNIRKILNFMEVCDADSEDGITKIKENAILYKDDNTKVLESVSDFLLSLTEYLNDQGSMDGLSELNSYKEVLLRAISKDKKETELVF